MRYQPRKKGPKVEVTRFQNAFGHTLGSSRQRILIIMCLVYRKCQTLIFG